MSFLFDVSKLAPNFFMSSKSLIHKESLNYEAQTSMPRYAYVTYLAGNGEDVEGVLRLAKSLREVESKHSLVLVILSDVPENLQRILVNHGCQLRNIERVYPHKNRTQFDMEDCVYSKLGIWKLEEFDKMVYLDSHVQVLENIDDLFDLPDGHLHAVEDCFCVKTWSHTPKFKIGYCQQCPDKVKWPAELGSKPALYFNAGMFVFEPNMSTYHDLLNTLKTTTPTPFAEQNLQNILNMFFQDIYNPISPIYNLLVPGHHPDNIELDKVRVVNYCAAGSKPWWYKGNEQKMEREETQMLVQKWWDIYNDESLDYKNCSSPAAASEDEVEILAGADEDAVIQQSSLEAVWEAAGCCSIRDMCLQPFLAAVSEAGCFFTEDLSLRPFLEEVLDVGCSVIEDMTSVTELYRGGYICGGFMCWF